jgi:hypothetical protein
MYLFMLGFSSSVVPREFHLNAPAPGGGVRGGGRGRRKTFFLAQCELGFYRFSFRLVRYVVSLSMEISLWIFLFLFLCVGFTDSRREGGGEG